MATTDPRDVFLRKFGSLTEIQSESLAAIQSGENCIITAPTGGGKTEAAAIPVFCRIAGSGKKEGIQAIYITPLRALNRDLMKRLESLAGELGISISARHGDTPVKERQAQAAKPPQVLITTPETVQNLFLSERLRSSMANVRVVIVDELHELYFNKRGAQLAIALERLEELSGGYQRIGISATIGDVEEAKRFLFGSRKGVAIAAVGAKKVKVIVEMPQKPVKEQKELAERFDLDQQTVARIERIADLVRASSSTLIFANTRQVVESLGSKLLYFDKIAPFGGIGVHHSSLDRDERISTENAFKEGRVRSIIATSSLELGIDIGSINLVLQYGSPRQVIRLVQRIGRGGHKEKETSYGRVIVASNLDALESVAIIDEMRRGVIERQKMEEMALDVLANQVCAIVIERKKVQTDLIYKMIGRAAPYEKLDAGTFGAILKFLSDERLIRLNDDGSATIGMRSREYFFTNISVIPDTVRFIVKNTASNRIISSLDEKFVSNYLDEGSVFITKGTPWKVVSIENDVIFVEQSAELEAAIPDWEGEDIPVSYETARTVFGLLKDGIRGVEEFADEPTLKQIEGFVASQKKHFVPEKDVVFIEELEDYSIMHTGLGKLANEFIARMVANVASQIAGTRVLVKSTPYAIIIDYSGAARRPQARKILETIMEYDIDDVVGSGGFLANTELFRYKFVQVCKLFGVVSKKAKVLKNDADRLIKFYKDSPIFTETARDLRKNYLDLENAGRFLSEIRSGNKSIRIIEEIQSPLTNEIMKAAYRYRELLMPALPDDSTIKEFEERISGKQAELLCTFCGLEFKREVDLESKAKIVCPNCKSPMIALSSDDKGRALKKKLGGKALTPREEVFYKESIREASLIEAYGHRALAAFATYGIGTATAARVLKLLRKSEKQFVIDLIEAQKNFVKTKKYWK